MLLFLLCTGIITAEPEIKFMDLDQKTLELDHSPNWHKNRIMQQFDQAPKIPSKICYESTEIHCTMSVLPQTIIATNSGST